MKEPGDRIEGNDEHPPDAVTIHLLCGPFVTVGDRLLEVPEGSKRLLAFVAIQRGRLDRRYIAGSLWPCCDEDRASGNLRSSLWRLRKVGIDVIEADKWSLRVADGVLVDLDEVTDWVHRMLAACPVPADFEHVDRRSRALDLLPGCYDDWVIIERERIRQQVLHGLERMSALLRAEGRHGEAVDAALTAVHTEPLRESAQRTLIAAHLAEGNLAEARAAYRAYARLAWRELGVQPSRELRTLIGEVPADEHPGSRPVAVRPAAPAAHPLVRPAAPRPATAGAVPMRPRVMTSS